MPFHFYCSGTSFFSIKLCAVSSIVFLRSIASIDNMLYILLLSKLALWPSDGVTFHFNKKFLEWLFTLKKSSIFSETYRSKRFVKEREKFDDEIGHHFGWHIVLGELFVQYFGDLLQRHALELGNHDVTLESALG